MKKSLEDASDLLRKKRDAPCSALGVWKLNSILRKEQIFHQPSLTGEWTFPFANSFIAADHPF